MMGVGIDYRRGLRGAVERQGGLGGGDSQMPGVATLPPASAGGGGAAGGLGGMPSSADLAASYRGGQQARAGIDQASDWTRRQVSPAGVPYGPMPPSDFQVPIAQSVVEVPQRFSLGGLAPIARQMRATRGAPAGLVHSASPGRADLVSARVRRGAYIVPADVVSSLGQGNTLAGASVLHSKLPEAAAMASAGPIDRAMGGTVEAEEGMDDDMDVRLSGGEYQISPEQVMEIGGGDVHAGAAALDRLVAEVRAAAQHHLATTPPPK